MKLYRYHLPNRTGLLLQQDDRFGEIAPLPGFSKETLADAEQETLAWLYDQKPPTLPSVRFGISCLQRHLGPIHLPLTALGPKPGFSTVKLKLGHLRLPDAIALVKKHLSHFQLRLDCNRAWSLSQALEFASHFRPTDFLYLEEPVQTFSELIAFSTQTHFPIALDESIREDWSQIPSLKAIVVKPTLTGAIPHVPPHLDLILSSSYESGIGLLHIAHLAQNTLPLGLDTVFTEDLLSEPIIAKNGYFSWQPTRNISVLSKYTTLLTNLPKSVNPR
jgi:O-succinylbenzoate synthase